MTRMVLTWAFIIVGILATLVMAARAVPVSVWRTAEVPLPHRSACRLPVTG